MVGAEARLRAQKLFGNADQRRKRALSETDKATAAIGAKTARLRSLRLAKEASDRTVAEEKASERKSAKRTPRDGT